MKKNLILLVQILIVISALFTFSGSYVQYFAAQDSVNRIEYDEKNGISLNEQNRSIDEIITMSNNSIKHNCSYLKQKFILEIFIVILLIVLFFLKHNKEFWHKLNNL